MWRDRYGNVAKAPRELEIKDEACPERVVGLYPGRKVRSQIVGLNPQGHWPGQLNIPSTAAQESECVCAPQGSSLRESKVIQTHQHVNPRLETRVAFEGKMGATA